jgi:hypothetical protein
MIALFVVVSSLPLIIEVGVGTSGDGENGIVGGKVIDLLRRLVDL